MLSFTPFLLLLDNGGYIWWKNFLTCFYVISESPPGEDERSKEKTGDESADALGQESAAISQESAASSGQESPASGQESAASGQDSAADNSEEQERGNMAQEEERKDGDSPLEATR